MRALSAAPGWDSSLIHSTSCPILMGYCGFGITMASYLGMRLG